MSAKGKERAFSPTDSITIAVITVITVLTKDTYPRITKSDTFSGDRKKFKVYEAQCRIYLWADGKRDN
jgi:hypothetical protein